MRKLLTIHLLTILILILSFSFNIYPQEKSTTTEVKKDKPIVYMTTDISPAGLMAVYDALDVKLPGKVAVKISTGEPGGEHYLSPDLIKDLVHSVNGTIVECNTGYEGGRFKTEDHMKVAKDHGFTAIANVDIMDADGQISLPFEKGVNIKEDFVGSHFKNYDSYIILSHFKGHMMGGFGGAIKNMSIGIASSHGKIWIHSAGVTQDYDWKTVMATQQDKFLESMAEAAGAIINYLGDKILYINVMNKLSVDCDCSNNPKAPTMKDIGILASLDPVALDQACVDWVYKVHDGHDLIKRMEEKNGIHTLEHGEKLGLGSRSYNLIMLDKESSLK
ncbi:MAG TPA: DUF362 domain-containing protein [Ignavibacteriaceae bacterium]|nr:DUF362 domain-containing protein [Ignavibacteriaceae bacterium]